MMDEVTISAIVKERERLRLENAELRAANAKSVHAAVNADLARAAAQARSTIDRETLDQLDARHSDLRAIARAVLSRIPEEAKIDRPGDRIVALEKTLPQLLRSLAELAKEPA